MEIIIRWLQYKDKTCEVLKISGNQGLRDRTDINATILASVLKFQNCHLSQQLDMI
jgi:hypothetical protein